jgi:uncharacterized membrane protein
MTPPDTGPLAGTEKAISRVLRVGVTTSLVLVTAGTLLSFLRRGGYGDQPGEVARLVGPGGAFPRTAGWLIGGLLHLDGAAVIVAGLVLLIATPVFRVAVSIVAFARERDRPFVVITAIVLGLLLLSLVLGKSG